MYVCKNITIYTSVIQCIYNTVFVFVLVCCHLIKKHTNGLCVLIKILARTPVEVGSKGCIAELSFHAFSEEGAREDIEPRLSDRSWNLECCLVLQILGGIAWRAPGRLWWYRRFVVHHFWVMHSYAKLWGDMIFGLSLMVEAFHSIFAFYSLDMVAAIVRWLCILVVVAWNRSATCLFHPATTLSKSRIWEARSKSCAPLHSSLRSINKCKWYTIHLFFLQGQTMSYLCNCQPRTPRIRANVCKMNSCMKSSTPCEIEAWQVATHISIHFRYFIPKLRHTDRQGISNAGQWNASEINAFLILSIAYKTSPERSSSTITIPPLTLTKHDKTWQNNPRPLSNMFKQDETIMCASHKRIRIDIELTPVVSPSHTSTMHPPHPPNLLASYVVSRWSPLRSVCYRQPQDLLQLLYLHISLASCDQSLADTKAI